MATLQCKDNSVCYTFDEWYNLVEVEVNIELAETGADREMDFDSEYEFDKRYDKYLDKCLTEKS